MFAVFVNCGTVILGSLIGILFAKKISGRMSEIVQSAAGIITLIIGLQSAFKYQDVIVLALSLMLGGITGTWLDIDGKIMAFGNWFQGLLDKKQSPDAFVCKEDGKAGNFGRAFLNATVLFCVGAMAIIGSLKAGIEKDYTIIYTKSLLDGFMSIVFASSMGLGTLFSFISIFLYQGALTLLSQIISPFITDAMLAEITGTGGALIVMIGLGLLKIKSLKTADYLPAVLFAVVFVVVKGMF